MLIIVPQMLIIVPQLLIIVPQVLIIVPQMLILPTNVDNCATNVDNCVTNVDNCATNATSRFKAFWACLPVCLSVAAITHHKTDVQLLPAVRCPAPSITKTGALCCSQHFGITLCRSSRILKTFQIRRVNKLIQ